MKTYIAAFSPHQTKNRVKLLEQFAIVVMEAFRDSISREEFRDSDGKNSHDFFYWNDQFQQ